MSKSANYEADRKAALADYFSAVRSANKNLNPQTERAVRDASTYYETTYGVNPIFYS